MNNEDRQKQPLSNIIKVAAQQANGQQAEHVVAYLDFIEKERGDRLPPQLKKSWSPFSTNPNLPSATLKLSDKELLDKFLANSHDRQVAETAVSNLLLVAWRMGVLSNKEAGGYGFKRSDAKLLLTHEMVSTLRDAFLSQNTLLAKRNLLIIDLMLFGGLRATEVIALKAEDVLDEGHLRVANARSIRMPETLKESLMRYTTAVDDAIEGALVQATQPNDKLSGQPVHRNTVSEMVKVCTGGERTPLDMRFTCAMTAQRNGVPLCELQHYLGFVTMRTCLQFLGTQADFNEAVDISRFITYDGSGGAT